MTFKPVVLGAALSALLVSGFSAEVARASDSFYLPLLTYRTGPFANSGIPIANGMHDYLVMLNERDGGIGGVPVRVEECETGYNTQQGIECYDSVIGDRPLILNPYSTGITLALIPRAAVDEVVILSMAYGLSASAIGEKFPWVFNPPSTYWDGASGVIKYIAEQEGGLDQLSGKKIGYIFFDGGYGREPIPLFQNAAEEFGFELVLYPVPPDQMQNQSSTWLNVRRDQPDYMVMWGWGAMNPTAVQEAARIRYPMDRFIGVWWSGGEDDARPAGDGAIGYKTLNLHGVGADFPAIQDIRTHVVDAGKSHTNPDRLGENLYNRGVYNSVLMAEAIRTAQELTGKDVVDAHDVRRGFENLHITEARWEEIGLPGFAPEIRVTCEDHNGHHAMYVQQWNGEAWEPISDWFEPMSEFVQPLIEAAAEEYVQSNQPWPERPEPCN